MSTEPTPPEEESAAARRERLLASVAVLPEGPGVYLFRNAAGGVAYIGKARNLRARVRSYFLPGRGDTRRAVLFVDRYVHTIESVSTASEPEAFLLENRLVKRHKPAYNVKLRDDKDFLYLRIDQRHPFPALALARRPRSATRGVSHHGPFSSATRLRATLRMLGGILPLRDCSDREFAGRTRPCLKHDMGRCSAPCVGLIEAPAYAALLDDALAVLQGRGGSVAAELERRMQLASREERFEQAARLRDQVRTLRLLTEPQQVENITLAEGDVLGLARAGTLAVIVVLFFRGGSLVSTAQHTLDSELPDEELLAGFLAEHYGAGRPAPREILLPCSLLEPEGLAEQLATARGGAVLLSTPQRGDRREVLDLAQRNAEHALTRAVDQRGSQRGLLASLAERLGLQAPPERIECYDVSHTGKSGIVASRVVFQQGEPDRAAYRHYTLKTLTGPDDYAALGEVLERRLQRAAEDPLPDLLIVDGGRGQLAVAERALENWSARRAAAESGSAPAALPVLAALAKGARRGRGVTLGEGERERLFLAGRPEAFVLERNTPEEYLLQRIRDEAHRFAISHHRKRRDRESLSSLLDEVPGVGPVLRQRLLLTFGGARGLVRASAVELAAVKGVGPVLAQAIVDQLGADDQPRGWNS
ncbi:MAG: excinuclease ABC subunit UvrC [Planctomycetota bacterium]